MIHGDLDLRSLFLPNKAMSNSLFKRETDVFKVSCLLMSPWSVKAGEVDLRFTDSGKLLMILFWNELSRYKFLLGM